MMSVLIAVSGLGVLCLLLEVSNGRKLLVPIILALLTVILGMEVVEAYTQQSLFAIDPYHMIVETAYTRGFSILFVLLTILLLMMSPRFYENQAVKIADYVAIKIFILAGAIAMVSFGNLVMFFIGLEVLSVGGYVLASSSPRDLKSNEAGMKYFIMGAFASSFTLMGITLLYGATGSFDVQTISLYAFSPGSIWFFAGIVLLSVGLFFKASVVPFHFWAPDVYEGSPALVAAMMSTLIRVAAIAALYRMFIFLSPAFDIHFQTVVIVLSILTMTVGNISALRQRNFKRMMAYSGISHTGFMIMALSYPDASSGPVLLYYSIAYSLAGIAAFSVILSVCREKENEDISHFYGLARQKPVLALLLSCAMLSMGGLPVFAGFLAKLFVFQQSNNLLLIIFGIINTVIAIYYYVRVINVIYIKENKSGEIVTAPVEYLIAGVVAIVLNVLLGIFPAIVMG